MDKIFLLPVGLVLIGFVFLISKSRPWKAQVLVPISLALFPAIFWSIRNLGPFFGGADIGAGLILIGSSILLVPIIIFAFFKTRNWQTSKALKWSIFILIFHFAISGTNHFMLLKQHKDFQQKSVLDCKILPFHCAVRDSQIDQIESLKMSRQNIESQDGWGRTALFYAYYSSGKQDYIKKLLSNGANPSAIDSSGYILPHYFLFNEPKNFELAELFFQYGFDVNMLYANGKKISLLTSAIVRKDIELIDYFISKGADPKLKDGYGYNACERLKVHGVENALKLEKLCQ